MVTHIQRVVTSGQFYLDDGVWDVENNVWLIGDEREVVIIDAAHDARAIEEGVNGRRVTAIVCTHAHNDHVNAAVTLAAIARAPVLLHPRDDVLWRMVHPRDRPAGELLEGTAVLAAGTPLHVLHTPGHTPGAVCLYAPELGALFSGDTLVNGGPGPTGRAFSDAFSIVDVIRRKLLCLPAETVVYTGHGDSTEIGIEATSLGGGSGEVTPWAPAHPRD